MMVHRKGRVKIKLTCTEEKFLLNDDELHPCVAFIPGARTVVTSVFLDDCLDTRTTYSAEKFFLGKRAREACQ